MKNLFTYPSNPSTNYIDPDYIGDANSGMTRRIDDLLDGTYKSWTGLDPISDLSATTPDIESSISKFVNSFDSEKFASNLSMYDFWYQPLVHCTMKLIDSVTIVDATYYLTPNEETIITTTVEHEFTDGQELILNNFNDQFTDFNGDNFYVKVLTPTTLQLAYDSALTNLLIVGDNVEGTVNTIWNTAGSTIGPYPGATPPLPGYPNYTEDKFELDMNTFVPDPGEDPLGIVNDGTPVRINTVEYNGADLATNTYYTKSVGSLKYELYEDQALTNQVLGSELTGNTNQLINGRLSIGYDKTWTASQYYSALQAGELYFRYDVSPADSDNFTNSVVPNWINYPLSQQQQDFIGFPGALSPPQMPAEDWSELLWAPTIPGFNFPDGWKPKGQSNIPNYYWMNKYRIIDATPTNGNLKMYFQSVLNGTNGVDPINTTNIDYYWETLTKTDFTVAINPGNTWHCLPMFDGFHFENFTRFGTYNLPDTAEVVNQPGLPVLDTKSSTLTFITNPGAALSGDAAVLTQSFDTPDGFGNGIKLTPAGIMNIVVWKPGTNLDDYRMSWDEYGLLNINEKDGGGNWTVPIYAVFERNDPTSPNMPYTPWNAPVLNWDISIGSVNAPCFIAQTDDIGSYYRLYPNDTAAYKPGNVSDSAGVINLLALQTLWPDLNLTSSSSIDVEISPCPYDIGVDDAGPDPWDSSNYSERKLWDNMVQPSGAYYQNIGDPYPNMYAVDYFNSGVGISCYTDSFPQSGGAKPTMFHMANRTTANTQNTGDLHVEFLFHGLPVATQGELAIDTGEPRKYEIDTLTLKLPGNETYSYQDTNNQTQFGGRIDPDRYWRAGQTLSQSYTALNEVAPTVAVTVDGNGKLSGVTLTETPQSEGLFTTGDDILLPIVSLADTYVAPVLTPAELADIWDTDDEWTDYGYNGLKTWPDHVTPRSAKIVYNSPTIVNNSQNGIKYTRSVGHTNWRLEVTYPAMTAEEFQKFHAVAQAAQGQAMPFFFNLLAENSERILWKDFFPEGGSTHVTFNQPVALGDTTALLDGFAGNEQNAFMRGEVFIDGKNHNGRLHTTLNTVDANAFGEAKIRTTWPFREAQQVGWSAFRDPFHAVVTLDSDNFEYSVDTANYYYVSVGFDLDSWK